MKLLADENLHNGIVQGLLRQKRSLDVVRVPDLHLSGADDRDVLAWAATEDRILMTHDLRTVPAHAYRRVERGERMPGVFAVRRSLPVARAIDDILLLSECSKEGEWEGQVLYLPFR